MENKFIFYWTEMSSKLYSNKICWVGYCGANCCTELIKVDEEEGDENG